MIHGRHQRAAAWIVSGALWPLAAADAAWELVPELGLTTEIDDNARIVTQAQDESTRAALDARLRIRSFGERGEVYIEPRFVTDAYGDERDKELENEDLFLVTRASRTLRRAQFGFRGDYRRESVLRSEIDDVLLEDAELGDELVDTGAGTLGTFTDERERVDLGFDVGVALSDRTELTLATSRIDVAYLENQSLTRTDFDNTRVDVVLTRLVDQRNQVSAAVYFSDFSAVRNANDTNAFGVEGAFLRPLSQTWTLQFDVGVVRTDFSYIVAGARRVEGVNNAFTFGFAFDKRSEATTWTIGAGRSLTPNSNGFLARRDDVRLGVRHRVAPRITFLSGLRAARIGRTGDTAGEGIERDYIRASIQLEWNMTERWDLTTGVDRVTQEYLVAGGTDAMSNALFVGVRYQGQSRD